MQLGFRKQGLDPLTRERLQALAADHLRQAIELESSGQTVPPDSDPTGELENCLLLTGSADTSARQLLYKRSTPPWRRRLGTPRQSLRKKRPRPTGRERNLDTHTPSALANRLLASLPHADFEALKSHLTIVPMAQGFLLFDVDQEVDQVYFPLSGMVSLLVVLKNGNAVETATIGREGVVGAMAGLGLHKSRVRAVIQLASTVARIPAPQFRKAIASSTAIGNLCIGDISYALSEGHRRLQYLSFG